MAWFPLAVLFPSDARVDDWVSVIVEHTRVIEEVAPEETGAEQPEKRPLAADVLEGFTSQVRQEVSAHADLLGDLPSGFAGKHPFRSVMCRMRIASTAG